VEFKTLDQSDVECLEEIFMDASLNKDAFFTPHSFDAETAKLICSGTTKDKYYGMYIHNRDMVAYGMLRGYQEGFPIPSLGIYVHSSHRGYGYGYSMMEKLHESAKALGSNQVRLTVSKHNLKAISLYKKMGYVFDENEDKFIGVLNFLAKEPI
jgi:ribosomal protein S18 acetylase RimI-like enzyme